MKIGHIDRVAFTARFRGSWSSIRRSKGVNHTNETDLEDIEVGGFIVVKRVKNLGIVFSGGTSRTKKSVYIKNIGSLNIKQNLYTYQL
jgi:hypothetical protein